MAKISKTENMVVVPDYYKERIISILEKEGIKVDNKCDLRYFMRDGDRIVYIMIDTWYCGEEHDYNLYESSYKERYPELKIEDIMESYLNLINQDEVDLFQKKLIKDYG